jgi:hypothetical protein
MGGACEDASDVENPKARKRTVSGGERLRVRFADLDDLDARDVAHHTALRMV